jgi:small subunit ribosomal protein S24e
VEVRIVEEHANPLLKRHEYHFEVSHASAATPSRDAVRGELSKLLSAPKDRVVIERMGARYGTATSRGEALVYESAEAAKSISRSHILVRNGLKPKEAPATPGAPAAEKPAEAPKSETAQESPAAPGSKPEPKAEHKPEPKADHKPEHKAEDKGEAHKPEHKGEAHKPEHKGEHKPEEKGEAHKPEHKGEHKPEEKGEAHKPEHKGEHKGKAAKSEKDEAAAKE